MKPKFNNRFCQQLGGDPIEENYVRQVPGYFWSVAKPTPVRAPRLLAHSKTLLATLGLKDSLSSEAQLAAVLAGNQLLEGMQPVAARYGGHQFGGWAGQLGDGRAIYLGEIQCPDGQGIELQLKGAGPTPYSRRGDGRAVLRSSLREFLCSEAMYYLGVPTTRALSLVETGQPVIRDMFYDGNPAPEPGAVVCRLSPSFLRFGNFEIHAATGELSQLRQLIAFTIDNYFKNFNNAQENTPSPSPQEGNPGNTPLLPPQGRNLAAWFGEVCRRTALLMVEWLRVGFVHGVMNTDNLSILGLTIDYGPYGWLDNYDPNFTPNTTDLPRRRYAFCRQPQIAQWNLVRLAEALAQTMEGPEVDQLAAGLEIYALTFNEESARSTARKFGFSQAGEPVLELAQRAYSLLSSCETDYTIFFRTLASVDYPLLNYQILEPAFYQPPDQRPPNLQDQWTSWLTDYGNLLDRQGQSAEVVKRRMNLANPWFIPRNYLAQQAIEAIEESNDVSMLQRLLLAAENPYTWPSDPQLQAFFAKRPEWARHKAGCSALSCSS